MHHKNGTWKDDENLCGGEKKLINYHVQFKRLWDFNKRNFSNNISNFSNVRSLERKGVYIRKYLKYESSKFKKSEFERLRLKRKWLFPNQSILSRLVAKNCRLWYFEISVIDAQYSRVNDATALWMHLKRRKLVLGKVVSPALQRTLF